MTNYDLVLIPAIAVCIVIGILLLVDYLSGKDYDSE